MYECSFVIQKYPDGYERSQREGIQSGEFQEAIEMRIWNNKLFANSGAIGMLLRTLREEDAECGDIQEGD